MAWTRAALALIAAGAVAAAVLSGGSVADPRTPAALPGLPPPFLGTAVAGSGGMTGSVDAYGDVVDLRAPGPAGRALIDNSAARQAAGSVAADTGIVPRLRIGAGAALPMWRADRVSQRYLPGTNVVRTVARFGRVRVVITDAAAAEKLALAVDVIAPPGARAAPAVEVNLEPGSGARCAQARGPGRLALLCSWAGARASGIGAGAVDAGVRAVVETAAARDRRWLARARPLGAAAPGWARRMYRRSLLVLRALTDRRSGAVAAGARDGWAYVWPRDAGTAALALGAAGYRPEAGRVAHFLLGLDLGAAARFDGDGSPVPGRAAQGDSAGWVAAAARAAGVPSPADRLSWRNRPDYREGAPGAYLANAIAGAAEAPSNPVSTRAGDEPFADGPQIRLYVGKSAHRPRGEGVAAAFGASGRLVREAGDPGSGVDSAAAWAVRPFPLPALYAAVRRSLLHLSAGQTRFGITPGEGWPGVDPWTAPTAWSAWSLAALSDIQRRERPASHPAALRDRRAALRLLADLRRASTAAGALPERVDANSGIPRSTTPLAWSHAFAILALRQLWP